MKDGTTMMKALLMTTAIITHIDKPMKAMATLLRQGRYADEIMQM